MTPSQTSIALILGEITRCGVPKTPRDLATLGARTAVIACGPPRTDKGFIDAAYGLAEGLHGDEWGKASELEKWTWIDMCEEEIRRAAADQARAPP